MNNLFGLYLLFFFIAVMFNVIITTLKSDWFSEMKKENGKIMSYVSFIIMLVVYPFVTFYETIKIIRKKKNSNV